MSEITDFDALRRAMAENSEQPEGPARNARAEQLLAEAEKLNIPLAVIEALGHQLKVYNYSSEKAKMFVPFARLLRMWDERPEDFDEYETHSLHWVFKWMSAGMLDQPHIPLAVHREVARRDGAPLPAGRALRTGRAQRRAQRGRARRGRGAGRAGVRRVAGRRPGRHGRLPRLRAARAGLVAGGARAGRRGAGAVGAGPGGRVTPAPTSRTRSSRPPWRRCCGWAALDEARANHLRGFRLVRAMESMRGAYADHVEFCALTGNEARGLELLAERPAYFTDDGHPRSRLDFMTVVALLMDRLTELGLGDRPVPGPAGPDVDRRANSPSTRAGRPSRWRPASTSATARRTSASGHARVWRSGRWWSGCRWGCGRPGRSPPLRRRAAGPSPPEAARSARAARRGAAAVGHPAAERRRGVGGGRAGRAGRRAGRRATGRRSPTTRRWTAAPRALDLFERAAELYAEAGDPGEALAARARAAYVRALAGEVDGGAHGGRRALRRGPRPVRRGRHGHTRRRRRC